MQSPSHDATRIGQVIDALAQKGHPVDRLLADAGVKRKDLQGDRPNLPFETVAALFETAAQTAQDDLLGLHEGAKRLPQEAGLLGYFSSAAPRVRELLKGLSRYRRIMSDASEMNVAMLDQDGSLVWHYNIVANTGCRQLIEFNAAAMTNGLRHLTGRNLAPIDVQFAHLRISGISTFARYFQCPVTFGASENRIRFTQETLALPLLTQDPGLYGILKQYCDEILARKKEIAPPVTARVEQEIVHRLSTGEARQDVVAATLGMSSRTLARRLSAEGTTFQKTLEGLREELARSYLANSSAPLTEIAFLLGYTDASSFSTAFRRWAGETPSEYRNNH